jgi:hypothetical protein
MTLLTKMDPCFEGLAWFKSALGPKGTYDFTGTAVDKIFDRYIPAVSFDFKWPGWIFERLVDRMHDQMNAGYPFYKREEKRLAKAVRIFKNECSRAARDYALGMTNMQDRVLAANVLMKTFNTLYKGL